MLNSLHPNNSLSVIANHQSVASTLRTMATLDRDVSNIGVTLLLPESLSSESVSFTSFRDQALSNLIQEIRFYKDGDPLSSCSTEYALLLGQESPLALEGVSKSIQYLREFPEIAAVVPFKVKQDKCSVGAFEEIGLSKLTAQEALFRRLDPKISNWRYWSTGAFVRSNLFEPPVLLRTNCFSFPLHPELPAIVGAVETYLTNPCIKSIAANWFRITVDNLLTENYWSDHAMDIETQYDEFAISILHEFLIHIDNNGFVIESMRPFRAVDGGHRKIERVPPVSDVSNLEVGFHVQETTPTTDTRSQLSSIDFWLLKKIRRTIKILGKLPFSTFFRRKLKKLIG